MQDTTDAISAIWTWLALGRIVNSGLFRQDQGPQFPAGLSSLL